MNAKYKVIVVESERGWGQKVSEEHLFDSLEEASAFVKQFNARNVELTAPDWYEQATEPRLVDLDAVKG